MADSAQDIIRGFLGQYGLTELADWAWALYTEGNSIEEIMLAMREQPAYQTRFPAMEALSQQGKAITEAEYIDYERTVSGLVQNWGIPKGMYDTPEGIANLLTSNVSAAEVNDRMRLAASAVYTAPKEVRDSMRDLFGLTPGDMVGYWLDPDKALPLLEKQYQAAEVTGAARQQQIGINLDEAMRLAQNGVTYDRALEGFGQVASMSDLSNQEQGGQAVGQGDLIRGVFGDAEAQRRMTEEARRRSARYQAAEGGAATGQSGVSGLRNASS